MKNKKLQNHKFDTSEYVWLSGGSSKNPISRRIRALEKELQKVYTEIGKLKAFHNGDNQKQITKLFKMYMDYNNEKK